jgi:hypothetical protein
MDLLTKFLLKEVLDNQKVVAIYGGGFKPPTKGHFAVAKKTLEDFPEIDELKIFVGGGVRDGITQDESIKIWNIYKSLLPDKIDVEPSVAPVKSVLGYAKDHPEEKVYWILGAREGDEDDLKDIESRTRSIDKYPNIEVKVITTSGGVSGTKTRQAIRDNNKEQFFHMIPDVSDEEKEQIWDMTSTVIKEELLKEEALIDKLKNKLKTLINAVKQESKETKQAFSLLIKSANGDIELTDLQQQFIKEQMVDLLKSLGLVTLAIMPAGSLVALLLKALKLSSYVTPSAFLNEIGEANLKPYKWEEVDVEGYFVYTRFTTDNETQYDVDIKSTVYYPPGQMDSVPALEIEFSAKPKGAEGSSAKIVVNKGEMYRVMATIVNIIKKYIKKSRAEAIIYSPSKKSDEETFGTQRDNLYRAFISKAFPETTFKQSGDNITAILPNNAALTLDEADPKKEQVTSTQVICDNCGWEWAIKDGGKDLYVCHKCGHDNTPKSDPFGLNELAKQFGEEVGRDLTKGWNPQKDFVSLSIFMIDNGMNIKPLPKIKVIKDDEENASLLLGKTAYYDPNNQSITLYTMNRHPKDVLRSFAHEMVHHEQNLEGRLNNINTTNTNEDGNLPEIEKEAYEKGNMMLRNWEDSIKNPVKEHILYIPKFNKPLTLTENLWKTLNEISLNPNNAAELEGDLYKGMFKAGNKTYTYDIYRIENPYKDGKEFYNVEFHPKNNPISTPTGDTTKEDYIKILNTMYKIILDFAEADEPDYIGIASMEGSSNKNYHKVYNNLTDNKFNNIPGYFRKDANLEFDTPQGKGRFVVLKRKNV